MIPHFKLTVGATTITDDYGLTIENRRPENNISSLVVQVDDYQSKSYVDLFDVHTQIELEIACENAGYTKTFSGLIHNLKPTLTDKGEVLEVQAWGWGIALAKTTCDTSFGTESANPNTFTPEQILDFIIAKEVVKRWDSSDTEWDMDTTDIDAPHADLSVTNLTGNYVDNFTLVNRLCDIINAHAVADSDISVHWYVDTDKHFRMKEIDQDSIDNAWKRYYGGSAPAATFYEGDTVISRGFHKHIEDYYNSIILASAFRKPAQDIWCEDNGPAWGNYLSTDTYSTDQFIVGSHSLKVTPTVNNDPALVFYPSTHNAGWNFENCESPNTIPRSNFYIYAEHVNGLTNVSSAVIIGKDWNGIVDTSGNIDYFYMPIANLIANPQANKWFHLSIPFGNYYAMAPDLANTDAEWIEVGAPDWDDIDFVAVNLVNLLTTEDYFLDDFHFSSKIVRHCYDTSEITATKKERQLLLRLDTAIDDTLETTLNTGTAARLCEAELYKRTTVPTIGNLSFPCHEDMLPGQTLQVYAGKKAGGTYRWSNQAMRVKELVHRISPQGYVTATELTSDVTNSNVAGVPSAWGLLMDHAGALGHGQAKDLKMSGIDTLIPRLSWDPT